MELGGIILYSGLVLHLRPRDYLYGEGRVRFTVGLVLEVREEWGCPWVVMTGMEKSQQGPWRPRRIQVRVSALKAALALLPVV